MTLPIQICQRFGSLVVLRFRGKGAGIPRRAECLCDCGRKYGVNVTRLFYGVTTMCRGCQKRMRNPPRETTIKDAFKSYRHSARYRNHEFSLDIEQFSSIYFSDCVYCGQSPAKGIDRRDNTVGYLVANCAPCCKQCNYAKRNLTLSEFLSWVARIAARQGFSL